MIAAANAFDGASTGPYAAVSGTVVARSESPEDIFLGTPSIAILGAGEYVATFNTFGRAENDTVYVFGSTDAGKTWEKRAEAPGLQQTLFVHGDALYLIGPEGRTGKLLIGQLPPDGSHLAAT